MVKAIFEPLVQNSDTVPLTACITDIVRAEDPDPGGQRLPDIPNPGNF